jgi:sporulation protein YlmC with PRC-barrel domain
MLLASEIERRPLTGTAGVELGRVESIIFHPSELCAVGIMVRPPAILYVVGKPDTFLPFAGLRFTANGVECDLKKLPTGRNAADGLGYDPETTIIWTGMDVRGPSGEPVGKVTDIELDEVSGAITRLEIAAGAVADTAHGRFVAPVGVIEGYRAGAIRATVEAGELEATGGFAKTAAETVVAVSQAANAAGDAIGERVVAASGATGRVIKAAADAEVAQRTVRRVRNTWRDSVKAFREGMKDDK